jgi:hypothetical protein
VKDFHQQYPNKPSTDAPDAKRRRTGKNWSDQEREEFHFNRHEAGPQQNYLTTPLPPNSTPNQTSLYPPD